MAKSPPERLAAALRANLARRKAGMSAAASAAAPSDPAKSPQDSKGKAPIPLRPKG